MTFSSFQIWSSLLCFWVCYNACGSAGARTWMTIAISITLRFFLLSHNSSMADSPISLLLSWRMILETSQASALRIRKFFFFFFLFNPVGLLRKWMERKGRKKWTKIGRKLFIYIFLVLVFWVYHFVLILECQGSWLEPGV